MRIIIVGLLALVLLYYLLWDTLVRKNPLNWLMIPMVSLLFLPLGLMELRWSLMEAKLSSISKEVAGRGGSVHCQRFSEAFFDTKVSEAGHVSGDAPTVAVVNYQPCQQIFAWLESGKGEPSPDQVQALHVLTHELVHVSGEYNEAVTECTAMNRDKMAVEALGGSAEIGSKVAVSYFESFWPKMPDSYMLKGCQLDPKFDTVSVLQKKLEAVTK